MSQPRVNSTDVLMVSVFNPATGQLMGSAPALSFASGTLASTTPVVVPLVGAPVPATITVSGTGSASRKIELSTDGGSANGWFTPTTDAATATMINMQLNGSATHARVTGATGDIWSVR